jgi:hypothetical protein
MLISLAFTIAVNQETGGMKSPEGLCVAGENGKVPRIKKKREKFSCLVKKR